MDKCWSLYFHNVPTVYSSTCASQMVQDGSTSDKLITTCSCRPYTWRECINGYAGLYTSSVRGRGGGGYVTTARLQQLCAAASQKQESTSGVKFSFRACSVSSSRAFGSRGVSKTAPPPNLAFVSSDNRFLLGVTVSLHDVVRAFHAGGDTPLRSSCE